MLLSKNLHIKTLSILLLVTAWPFMNFMYANSGAYFEYIHVLGYGAGTFLFFLLVYFFVKLIFRQISSLQVILVICTFIIALFNFENFLTLCEFIHIEEKRYGAIIWLVLTMFLMWAANRFAKSNKAWTISIVAASVMFVVPTVGFAFLHFSYSPQISGAILEIDGNQKSQAQTIKPNNIYLITPDSYPRADVLMNVYGYDNSDFLAKLRNRGFRVAENSYANYYTTFLSMSSMFNLDYFDRIVRPEGLASDMLKVLGAYGYSEETQEKITIGNSIFVKTLKSYGYSYIFGGVFHCDPTMDYCFSRSWIFIPEKLSRLTPFDTVRSFLNWEYEVDISVPTLFGTSLYLELPEIIDLHPGPKLSPSYTYIHLMMPHAPYRYKADCSKLKEPVYVDDWFNSDAIPYFVGQVKCINLQILNAIDKIMAEDPSAHIIIQADTGTIQLGSYYTPLNEWTDDQFEESYAILTAVKLDGSCQNRLYYSYTPINLARILLSCIDNIDRPRRPDGS